MHELLTNSLIFNKKITAEYLKMNEGEQYSMSDLEYILKNSCITLKTILRTQKLTPEFCVKYLLDKNEDQCISDMDRYITVNDILRDQPHITLDDITDGLYGGATMDHMQEIPSFEMMPAIQLPPLPPQAVSPSQRLTSASRACQSARLRPTRPSSWTTRWHRSWSRPKCSVAWRPARSTARCCRLGSSFAAGPMAIRGTVPLESTRAWALCCSFSSSSGATAMSTSWACSDA